MVKPLRPLSYWRRHREQKCLYSGYWFPHRRNGGACNFSPRAEYYQALRQGVPKSEAKQLLSADQLDRLSNWENK